MIYRVNVCGLLNNFQLIKKLIIFHRKENSSVTLKGNSWITVNKLSLLKGKWIGGFIDIIIFINLCSLYLDYYCMWRNGMETLYLMKWKIWTLADEKFVLWELNETFVPWTMDYFISLIKNLFAPSSSHKTSCSILA